MNKTKEQILTLLQLDVRQLYITEYQVQLLADAFNEHGRVCIECMGTHAFLIKENNNAICLNVFEADEIQHLKAKDIDYSKIKT